MDAQSAEWLACQRVANLAQSRVEQMVVMWGIAKAVLKVVSKVAKWEVLWVVLRVDRRAGWKALWLVLMMVGKKAC